MGEKKLEYIKNDTMKDRYEMAQKRQVPRYYNQGQLTYQLENPLMSYQYDYPGNPYVYHNWLPRWYRGYKPRPPRYYY